MNKIGDQIKKYRIEKGITQEQLGQILGVTTQAVSRWERGGTPDVELLPVISETLDVSLDTLFGREQKSFPLLLARRIGQLPQEEAYRYAFNICWAIEIGLMGRLSEIDDYMSRMLEQSSVTRNQKTDFFARVIRDSGIGALRMSPNFQSFFLLSEQEGSLSDRLEDPEKIRRIFEVFADEKMLRIMYYLHSVPNMPKIPVATSLISKNTGLPEEEVDRCMDVLQKHNLVIRSTIETADGEIHSYLFRTESFAIPLLIIADELAKKDARPMMGIFDRTKPFL